MRNNTVSILTLLIPTLVAGCGGGGGSSTPVVASTPAVTSFPLQSAFKSLYANGMAKGFTISGTCSGSGNRSISTAATTATFEGIAALAATQTMTGSYANCLPATFAQSSTAYFDSNYVPLGSNTVGVNYAVYLNPPTMPTSVAVGGTGTIGTQTLYTDSTKATGNGRADLSYVIEADTSTTAIVNVVAKLYNASSTLIATEQDRWRIAATGAVVPVSVDIQYSSISTNHIVWTYN